MKKSSDVFINGKEQTAVTVGEGVTRKILGYSENVMVCKIKITKGKIVKSHRHMHEQCSTVIAGKCIYTVGEESKTVETGDSVMVAANLPHQVEALEDVILIDVFAPMREDFI